MSNNYSQMIDYPNDDELDDVSMTKLIEAQESKTDIWLVGKELDSEINRSNEGLKRVFGDIIDDLVSEGFGKEEAIKIVRHIVFHK
ncbi:hypothetical protein CVV43_03390 [Candidatus Saccharibacteria bacterium HGW-Saccharibacteria-1]|nr:MAG: hypothetical protein CVV43_03390 [Candidatus Saccharibacteria bacterium HGW-Saccharibacteria-1]